VLSSCPVELPKRLTWLKSGRFLRLLSAAVALAALAAVLYNAIMVDRIPPTYTIQVSTLTSNGLAPTLASIDVTFSEAVEHTTAEKGFAVTAVGPASVTAGSSVVAPATVVAGTFHWQGDTKLIFTPSAKLPLSTKFHVHMAAGVTDRAGNAQAGTGDADFTTVGLPVVSAVVPALGADSVAVDSSITITFDRLMDTDKVIKGLSLKPDITYQASWNLAVLTLTPTRPMAYGTTYTVQIGDPAVDTDGTKLSPYTTSFKTVGVGLRATAVVPSPNVAGVSVHSQIAVTFDSPIDPASITGALTITPPVSGSTSAISLPDDRNPTDQPTPTPAASTATVLVFTPDHPLASHTTYTVALSSTVKRTDGQVATGETWSFTTGEPPTNALNEIAFTSSRGGVDNVWLMNFDGSNARQVTSELVPVTGYDISGDGTTIAYSAGGVVKKMSLGGDNVTTLTPTGDLEYSPTITPDGTGLVVGRRDPSGKDLGYWRYPLANGGSVEQLTTDGAPAPGSVAVGDDGLTGQPGAAAWASRAAFTADGTSMLLVRGADNGVEVVDMTGVQKPSKLSLVANSRPVWVQSDGAFYLAASDDGGTTWAFWRVTPAGSATKGGPATGDIATDGRGLAVIVKGGTNVYHLAYSALGNKPQVLLVNDPLFSESSPSFSPDGSVVVFGRVDPQTPTVSAGIWTVKGDGSALTNISTDGAFPRWIP
jgi:hypothetical protein